MLHIKNRTYINHEVLKIYIKTHKIKGSINITLVMVLARCECEIVEEKIKRLTGIDQFLPFYCCSELSTPVAIANSEQPK